MNLDFCGMSIHEIETALSLGEDLLKRMQGPALRFMLMERQDELRKEYDRRAKLANAADAGD